jgi:predicted DNA-binding WGR domain protein
MKVFFFAGLNPRNKSGASWKIWKIERQDRKVQVWWGPAMLEARRMIPTSTLQTKAWTFRKVDRAISEEQWRIREKLAEGYKRNPKWTT